MFISLYSPSVAIFPMWLVKTNYSHIDVNDYGEMLHAASAKYREESRKFQLENRNTAWVPNYKDGEA